MHLSLLSDGYVSDSLKDSTPPIHGEPSDAKDHLRGIQRGLLFALALLVWLAAASAATWLHLGSGEALTDAGRAVVAAGGD